MCFFLPVACHGIQFSVSIVVYRRLCIGILDVLNVLLHHMERVLPAQMTVWDWCYWCYACTFLCGDVYGAAVFWHVLELCVCVCVYVLLFCEYRIFEIKQYFIRLLCWYMQ
jgi:uncharacterized membrane protein